MLASEKIEKKKNAVQCGKKNSSLKTCMCPTANISYTRGNCAIEYQINEFRRVDRIALAQRCTSTILLYNVIIGFYQIIKLPSTYTRTTNRSRGALLSYYSRCSIFSPVARTFFKRPRRRRHRRISYIK